MMKKVKDFKFTFKYAFKNIYFNKLKSLALVSIFIVIFVLSFLLFSLKGLIHNYYYHDLNNTYKNHDLVISVTENTNARFFSIRELEHEAINDITPLLKIQTLINFEEQAYVNVLAGDITALNKLNNYSSTSELLKNQMIVTKSLAQKLGLTKGDLVLLQLDSSQSFEVVEIINDDGLINGNTIYISKDANVDHILIALGLGNINPAVLNNIYNLVYLDVNDLNIVDEIQLINGFENLKIAPVYNESSINNTISKTSRSAAIIFIFIMIAVVFVFRSLIANNFKDKVSEIGILKSLGANSNFYLKVILKELFIYYVISGISGLLLANLFIDIGLETLNSTLIFKTPLIAFILGVLLTGLLIFLGVYTNYRMLSKRSVINLSKTNQSITKSYQYHYLIIIVVLLAINNLIKINIYIKSSINLFLIIILGFVLVRILVSLTKYLKNKSLFKLITVNNINNNKLILNNLKIILISFLVISLSVISINYNQAYYSKASKVFNADLMITNIAGDPANDLVTVESISGVKDARLAYVYQNVQVNDLENASDYMVSIETKSINNYVDLGIDDVVLNDFNQKTKPYIILPLKYLHLRHYQVGDEVRLDMVSNISFEVLAFHNSSNSQIMLTNLIELEQANAVLTNSILVSANSNVNDLYQNLVNEFSSKLYYVINLEEELLTNYQFFIDVFNYVNYLAYIVIACFMLTVISNAVLIFSELKTTYQKLKVLGTSKRQLIKMFVLENFTIVASVLINGLIVIIFAIPNVEYFAALLDVYLPLSYQVSDLIIAFSLFLIVYGLSNLVYLNLVLKERPLSR